MDSLDQHQLEQTKLVPAVQTFAEAGFAVGKFLGFEEPGECIWYVDGVERARAQEGVPDVPMFVLANLAVGGDWRGAPDEATKFPASMDIDYIRVWQRVEQ